MFSFFRQRKLRRLLNNLEQTFHDPDPMKKLTVLCAVLADRTLAIKYITRSATLHVMLQTPLHHSEASLTCLSELCDEYEATGVYIPTNKHTGALRTLSVYDWLETAKGLAVNADEYCHELANHLNRVVLLITHCESTVDQDYLLRRLQPICDELYPIVIALYKCGLLGATGGIR